MLMANDSRSIGPSGTSARKTPKASESSRKASSPAFHRFYSAKMNTRLQFEHPGKRPFLGRGRRLADGLRPARARSGQLPALVHAVGRQRGSGYPVDACPSSRHEREIKVAASCSWSGS
jgi:hypothetical protein